MTVRVGEYFSPLPLNHLWRIFMNRFFKSFIRKIGYRFIRILIPCIIALILILSCSINSFAETLTFKMPFSAPQIADNNGYLELFYNLPDGTQAVQVIGWSIYSSQPSYSSYVDINITSNSVSFQPVVIGNGNGVFVSYRLLQSGNQNQYAELITENFISNYSMENLISYRVYGNYRQIHSSVSYSDFVISYGGNVSINIQLDKIIEILGGGTISSPPINNDSLNNYQQNEELIQQGTNQGIAEGRVLFNDIDTIANSSTILSGLSAMSALVNNFLNSDTNIYTLVRVGLSLGFFAFVVGMTVTIIKFRNKGG